MPSRDNSSERTSESFLSHFYYLSISPWRLRLNAGTLSIGGGHSSVTIATLAQEAARKTAEFRPKAWNTCDIERILSHGAEYTRFIVQMAHHVGTVFVEFGDLVESASIVSQRDHRVYFHCPPRRHEAGQQGHRQQRQGRRNKCR